MVTMDETVVMEMDEEVIVNVKDTCMYVVSCCKGVLEVLMVRALLEVLL